MESEFNNKSHSIYPPPRLLNRKFWSDVFFNFLRAYPNFIKVGIMLLIFFAFVLYVQKNYPYTEKEKNNTESVQSESTQEKNIITDVGAPTAKKHTDTFQVKYQKNYEGIKGVSQKKAKQLVKKYLCYSWDGMTITPEAIQIGSTIYSYEIVHVHKNNKKTIIAFLEITSSNSQGTLIKFRGKDIGDQYTMECWIISESDGLTMNNNTPNNHTEDTSSYDNNDGYDFGGEDYEYDDREYEYEDNEDYSVDYILPTSSTQKLRKKDLKGLSKEQLRLARNEIYARHGRRFQDEELQDYFNGQDWYDGTIEPEDFDDVLELNDIERYNAKLILEYEQKG